MLIITVNRLNIYDADKMMRVVVQNLQTDQNQFVGSSMV